MNPRPDSIKNMYILLLVENVKNLWFCGWNHLWIYDYIHDEFCNYICDMHNYIKWMHSLFKYVIICIFSYCIPLKWKKYLCKTNLTFPKLKWYYWLLLISFKLSFSRWLVQILIMMKKKNCFIVNWSSSFNYDGD
jgi:hypothetical protein